MENQTKKWAQKKLNTNFHKVIRGSGLVKNAQTDVQPMPNLIF